jgi:serine/threonine protein kinase
MPNYISVEVKDLISRMLQPNPVKRITINELKNHTWFLQDLPDYIVDLSLMHTKASAAAVDHTIVSKLLTVNILPPFSIFKHSPSFPSLSIHYILIPPGFVVLSQSGQELRGGAQEHQGQEECGLLRHLRADQPR